jgi:protein-tyrosine phosphatase
MRILFVCLGNICRSPTAEGVLRHRLAAAGLGADVDVEEARRLAGEVKRARPLPN